MCGLFGYYSFGLAADPGALRERLIATQRTLHHRGPDDRGLETFSIPNCSDGSAGSLFLGHTRLSIIDLSPSGHQPMLSSDGRYTIIFNGEIYNYIELRSELKSAGYGFTTDTDTEVLLAAWRHWGVGGLHRLTGMFSFAVYDRQDQSLTLVRDAFGIKPLFLSYDSKGFFCFASEVSALIELLEHRPKESSQRAYDYLVHGRYDDGEDTFYEGVRHLLPGHWLRLDLRLGTFGKPHRWWWPSIEVRSDLSFEDAAAQLREMFLKNVRLHLRSDAPLGAALSGGLDSSAVVCAMRYLEPNMPIHTFTYVARGSAVDEERWADIVNVHVGAIAHKIFVSPNELADDLDDLIRAQGEPFGSTSIYAQYRVFKAAREAGITVTLDGQGADELLAGYRGYPDSFLRSLLEQRDYMAVPSFVWEWSKWPNRGMKPALFMLGSAVSSQRFKNFIRRLIGERPIPPWLNTDWVNTTAVRAHFSESQISNSECNGRRLVEQLRFALTGSGLAALLRHGDRNSMRWSVESRVPFLTTDLAEFLLRLPESYLLSKKGETKHIFRAAMRGLVPDSILDRRDKIGFQTPEHEWLGVPHSKASTWFNLLKNAKFLDPNESKKSSTKKNSDRFPVWRTVNYQAWLVKSE